MEYEPVLNPSEAYGLFKIVFNNYRMDLSSSIYEIMSLLLSRFQIDLNAPFNRSTSNASIISIAAEKKDIKLLNILKDYNANFKDCRLRFESMISSDYLPVYNFLKENGCRFNKRVIDVFNHHKSKIHSSTKSTKYSNKHLCPLHKIVNSLMLHSDTDVDVLIFMLDFSAPDQILSAKQDSRNLIDIFMLTNSYNGVIKAFSLVNGIFYPLLEKADIFNKWVIDSNDPHLINIVFQSGLKILKHVNKSYYIDEIDYDSDSGDSHSSDSDFDSFNYDFIIYDI